MTERQRRLSRDAAVGDVYVMDRVASGKATPPVPRPTPPPPLLSSAASVAPRVGDSRKRKTQQQQQHEDSSLPQQQAERGRAPQQQQQHDNGDGGAEVDEAYRVGRYVIGRFLGAGSFSRVFECRDVASGRCYAMKIVNRTQYRKTMDPEILRELAIMERLQHPYIIRLVDVMKSKRHFYIVMQLINGGELAKVLEAPERLPEREARRYFQQLMVGLRHMHRRGVAHRDLKIQNILLDGAGNVRISDFGLSNVYQDGRLMWSQCGTIVYMAPEIFMQRGYSGFAADVWSAGCILFYLVSGQKPFSGGSKQRVRDNITANRRAELDEDVSAPLRELVEGMLTPDPGARMSVEDVIRHRWVTVDFDVAGLQWGS